MVKKDYSDWSKEQLANRVKELEKRKKYGLVWDEEKEPENVVIQCKDKLPILKEIKDKEIIEDRNKPTNILIEGDNYHALSVLNYTHKGKIDVIYIDPPYNTLNETGFIYNDKIVDENDVYRHSKWLNFMEKRLRLAKNLLKENGVIFINIDDNEFAQLKLICDEIFGPENFIVNIIWQKKYSPQNDATYFSNMHDYILCYARRRKKNKSDVYGWERNLLPRTEEGNKRYKNPDNDPRGNWKPGDLTAEGPTPNCIYTITCPKTKKKFNPPEGKRWVFSKESFLRLEKENRIWFGKNGGNVPALKRFESEVQKGYVPNSMWFYNEVGHTQEAKKELNNLFGGIVVFETPKPVRLMRQIINLSIKKKGIILDFFAGSGSIAHAALELNKEDGGDRNFILCTNNENNICTDVCYPRIKKVIEGYTTVEKQKIEGLGGNFKYYKTDFVDAEPTDKNKAKLTREAIEMLCIKEDTFEQVLEKEKFKVFRNEEKYTAIILDYRGIKEFKKSIKDIKGEFNIYIFSLGDDTFEEEFEDLKQKFKLSPIPEVILRVYRRIFK